MELDYLLGHHARTLLGIGPQCFTPIYENMPTNEERQLRDLDINSEKEGAVDPYMGAKSYGQDNNGYNMDDA